MRDIPASEFIQRNKLYIFVGVGILLAIVGFATILPTLHNPQPPEEKPFVYSMEYGSETLNFSYTFTEPGAIAESSTPVPERVIIHTSKQITRETRLHEFNPTAVGVQQTYKVDLISIASNPEDYLRTHPPIYMSVIYSNGSREIVSSSVAPQNIKKILGANYSIEHNRDAGSVSISAYDIVGDRVVVKTPKTTKTIKPDSETNTIRINPTEYYVDKNNDGIYETAGEVTVLVQYNNTSKKLTTISPSYPKVNVKYGLTDDGKSYTLSISDMNGYESVTVYTPNGNYILKEYYNSETESYVGDGTEYVHRVSGVGDKIFPTLTISNKAESVKILATIDGTQYVIHTISNDT